MKLTAHAAITWSELMERYALYFFILAFSGSCLTVAPEAIGATAALGFSNGSFEDGVLDPWFQGRVASGGEDWNVTSVDSHSGNFSATNTGNKELRQNFPPVPVAKISHISFWLKHVGFGVDTNVILYFSNGSDTNANAPTTTNDAWRFFDVSFLADPARAPGSHVTGFSIYGNSAGDPNFTRTYIDDVTIVVPEPSTFVLTAAGLAFGVVRTRLLGVTRHCG
jgi:hypothetical protein